MKDRETKVSKGAAFVRFKTLPAAQAAIEGLNGQTSMDERLGPLSVSFASGESSRLGLDEGVLNAPEGQTKLFIGLTKAISIRQRSLSLISPYCFQNKISNRLSSFNDVLL